MVLRPTGFTHSRCRLSADMLAGSIPTIPSPLLPEVFPDRRQRPGALSGTLPFWGRAIVMLVTPGRVDHGVPRPVPPDFSLGAHSMG